MTVFASTASGIRLRARPTKAGRAVGTALRIAVVTETYPPEVNGVAISLGRLVEGLRERGHRVMLIRPAGEGAASGRDPDERLVAGAPIPFYAGLRFGFPAGRQLAGLWREAAPDVVHVVTEGPLGWSAVRTARRLGLPVSSDFRTNFDAYSRHYGLGWLQRPIAAYLRHLHNATDLTCVPTGELQRSLRTQGYRRVEVVARGVDRRLFDPARRSAALRARWGLGEDGLAVIHVGRLAPEKNLPLLLAAFAALARARPDARLVFVGDGPSRLSLQRRHPGHVYAGLLRGAELAEHYASGDLFVLPSLTETFGNVALEALASGVPVLAFAMAGAGELVRAGCNGVLIPPGDETAFVRAAVELAADPARLSRLRQQAGASVAGHDWDAVIDRFSGCLLRLVRDHACRHHAPTAFFPAAR